MRRVKWKSHQSTDILHTMQKMKARYESLNQEYVAMLIKDRNYLAKMAEILEGKAHE